MAVITSGTAAAQAIAMMASPLLTRIYGPEALGLLGVFTAIMSMLVPVAALSYPIAIVLPKGDGEARSIMKLSFLLSFSVAALVAIVLWVFGSELVGILDAEGVSDYLMLLPAALIFSSWVSMSEQWLIRKHWFRLIAKVAVLQAIALNSSRIVFGLYYPFASTLMVAAVGGAFLHATMLWLGVRKSFDKSMPKSRNEASPETLSVAKKYSDFPLYRAPQSLLNGVSQSLPILLLSSFFGPSAAGYYGLAKTVLSVPIGLIGKSVGDVFYPRITEAFHKGDDLTPLLLKSTVALAVLGAAPFSIVIVFGPQIFELIFGDEWGRAGEYASWMAVWLYAGFCNRPSVVAMATLSMQRFFLVYEGASLLARTAAILVGFLWLESDLIAVALYSITGFFANLFLVVFTVCESKSITKKVKEA